MSRIAGIRILSAIYGFRLLFNFLSLLAVFDLPPIVREITLGIKLPFVGISSIILLVVFFGVLKQALWPAIFYEGFLLIMAVGREDIFGIIVSGIILMYVLNVRGQIKQLEEFAFNARMD